MNPLGTDFVTTVPEITEVHSPSTAPEPTGEEFLNQFLDMLFSEPDRDLESDELPDICCPAGQRDVHPDSKDQPSDGVEDEPGRLVDMEPERVTGECVAPENRGRTPDILKQSVEVGRIGEVAGSQTKVTDNAGSNETENTTGSRLAVPADQPFVRSNGFAVHHHENPTAGPPPPSESFVLRTPSQTESSPRPAYEFTGQLSETDRSVPEAEGKPLDPSFVSSEPGSTKVGENSSLSFSQIPVNPVSTPLVAERPGSIHEGPAASRLEPRAIEAEIVKRLGETGPDPGLNREQNETRNHQGSENMTREEPLLRRLVVQESAHSIEQPKTVSAEGEQSSRIQAEPERAVQDFGKTVLVEKDQSSETFMTPRPETTSNLVGTERATFQEPLTAKEFVQGTNPENFDRILDQIVKRITLQQNGETFQLGVRLKPEFLGEIRIETVMDPDQTIRAVIRAEDSSVKILLESKVEALVQKLHEAGIRVDTIEIETLSKDGGSATDSNNGRSDQSPAHAQNRSAAKRFASELHGQDRDSAEEHADDHDDGHIHLFI